jgi:hypothetical protein
MLRENDAEAIIEAQKNFDANPTTKTLEAVTKIYEAVLPKNGGDAVTVGDLLASQYAFANNPSARNFITATAHMLVWQYQRTR